MKSWLFCTVHVSELIANSGPSYHPFNQMNVAGTIGTLQANEILKNILNIGQNLNRYILILDLLNINFRKAKINKRKKCICS